MTVCEYDAVDTLGGGGDDRLSNCVVDLGVCNVLFEYVVEGEGVCLDGPLSDELGYGRSIDGPGGSGLSDGGLLALVEGTHSDADAYAICGGDCRFHCRGGPGVGYWCGLDELGQDAVLLQIGFVGKTKENGW